MHIRSIARLLTGAAPLIAAVLVAPVPAAAADPGVTLSVSVPAAAATGDQVLATYTVTNQTDHIVTLKFHPVTPPMGPDDVAAYEHDRLPRFECPASGCATGIAPGGSSTILSYFGVAAPGTLEVGASVTVDGVDGEASASASTAVSGPACTVRGTYGNDVLRGTDPAGGVLCGFFGSDHLVPGPGSDLFLADRADQLDLDQSRAPGAGGGWDVDLAASPATARNRTAGTTATIHGGIWMVVGSAGPDRISGTSGVNSLDGGAGDDRLDGRGGNDSLSGGRGDDVIIGGPGTDNVVYAQHTHPVQVFLSTNRPQQTGGAGVDTLSTTVENLTGTLYDDLLVGDEGANTIVGGLGDDRLVGRGGDDYLVGSKGADRYDGGTGTDVCKDKDPTKVRTSCERWD
ncbi:MAG: calcium-binding protein [Acidimicrobiales bacterium]